MFVVDTNLLIDAANADSPLQDRCRSLIQEWQSRPSAWFLTLGICYEFMRVATHPRVFGRPLKASEAWGFVAGILASPSVSLLVPTERHPRVAQEVFAEIPGIAGNLVFDAATAVLMREHGIKTIYTRDTDFHRFRFLEVVDPTA